MGGRDWSDFVRVYVCTLRGFRDKPHPFVRLGLQFDASHLPGASEGHEPLGSRRSWVCAQMYLIFARVRERMYTHLDATSSHT